MSNTALALNGLIAWYLILLGMIWLIRAGLTTFTKRPANSYSPDGADVSPFSQRLCRAHANMYEGFPYLAGPLLLALATGNTSVTDGLACILLGARVLQSTVHLISTSNIAVQARFAFFVVQWGIAAYWVVQFAGLSH
ncbi:MAPEG family protein [Limnobacter humi]|uniref:MAPEG family protein n=1 Tax=Limnobacter humi TaxID=1778671 RepID=A0ABT1WD64_9BURK|nr:MAPEG family protein [Limnobacter humi]MCQ8895455.1 MAPEG family protein [Limnobacter humi]